MKITVYTTTDCQFSKQEKEYLNTNKLVFEEKNLETNKDFLTEMMAISNNFAGTPVTRVEKDDGSIAVLKGFTKEEFDTTFGFVAVPNTAEAVVPGPSVKPNDTPISPVADIPTVDVAQPVSPIAEVKPAPEVVPTPTDLTGSTDSTVSPDPLKSVMDSLQTKAQDAVVAAPPVETPMTQAPQLVEPAPVVIESVQPVSPPVADVTPTLVDLPKVPEPDFK